jgi:hypothetical protein
MHELIPLKLIKKVIFTQSIKKAPGPDRLTFQAIKLLWGWDKPKISTLIQHCFRLGYHLQRWKLVKGILLRKSDKPNHLKAKNYRVISLLNCLGKVIEKIAAERISSFCERHEALYEG